MEEIGNIGQRIRELAVQAANDTNSASDRQALNNEVQQLIAEAGRIAQATQFNDQNVLDGSLEEILFQVGANRGQTISVDGVDARSDQLGAQLFAGDDIDFTELVDNANATTASFNITDDLTINGEAVDLSGIEAEDGFADVDDIVAAINAVSGDTGVEADRALEVEATIDASGHTASNTGLAFSLNGVDITVDGTASQTEAATRLADAINEAGVSGVSAQIDPDDDTQVVLSGDGADLQFTQGADSQGITFVDGADLGANEDDIAGFARAIELTGQLGESVDVQGTDVGNLGLDNLGDGEEKTLASVDISTRDNASDAIRSMDFVLAQVNSLRADLGAVQNRFESTVANLSVTSENLEASRSRILDADFAAETAALTRSQILQQAGTSVLAQANQLPNNVLALLQ